MISNRSVPTNTVLPHIVYQKLAEAIPWLIKTFGFAEHYRYGDPADPSGAQLHLGDAWIMVRSTRPGTQEPAQLGCGTQSLTVFVEEIEEHFRHAKSAGAKIVEDLHEVMYGELQYAAEDLDGHHWLFSKHVRDVSPEEWGAIVSPGTHATFALRPRPSFCYIEIPARDVHLSADFYEKVFGWNIRKGDTDRPSFDDASGHISGAWVTGRPPASVASLLPYIWVDDIAATLKLATLQGATVVQFVHPDHPGGTSQIATFHDPAGNLIGLYQEAES
jgi:predicted enzyme related to lactoylglutathione lyase/uncharacterized glyoxalase superfamily protein PhnB